MVIVHLTVTKLTELDSTTNQLLKLLLLFLMKC